MRPEPQRRPPTTLLPIAATAAATALAVASAFLPGRGAEAEDPCSSATMKSAGVRCATTAVAAGAPPTASATPTQDTAERARPGVLDQAGAPPPRARTSTTTPTTSPPPVASALPPGADPARPALIVTPGEDAPNPFVLVEGDRYLMYATETRGHFYELLHIPVRESTDLRTWTIVGDALPVLPAWAAPGATWAPDVARVSGGYVMYVTARLAGTRPAAQCIGAATSTTAIGPFVPQPTPIVCQLERRGSIDPRSFVDAAGQRWLHWKSDDNADTEGTTTSSIYAQRLSDDGVRLLGRATRILEVDQSWEGRIVEAPDLQAGPDGRLWLFYSGNWFNQPAYGLGVALCETPAGPCSKPFDGPWLSSNAQGDGPGEGALFTDREGTTWIAYSPIAQRFESHTKRPVALGRVAFDALGPYLADPDTP